MPVSFLSQAQREHYGRYPGPPSPPDLIRYFHLDDADQALIARGPGERQGNDAVQLTIQQDRLSDWAQSRRRLAVQRPLTALEAQIRSLEEALPGLTSTREAAEAHADHPLNRARTPQPGEPD